MADLGTPQVVQTQAPAQDSGPIAQGVDVLANIAATARTEGIVSDLNEDLNTRIDATPPQDAEAPALPEPTGDPELDNIRNRLATLTQAAQQGNRSQQKRAELEARRTLEDYQNRFPRLRSQLATEFSSVLRTDTKFEELGLSDVGSAAIQKDAVKELDAIKSKAYGSIESQGLGMDPLRLPLGSPEFAQEYLYRSNLRQSQQENALYLQNINAQRDRGVEDVAGDWQRGLLGQANVIRSGLAQTSEQVGLVTAALRAPDKGDNPRIINEWNSFRRDQHLSQVEKQIAGIEADFNSLPISFAGTDKYAQMEKLKNSTVEGLRTLASGIATDNPTIMQVFEAETAIKTLEFREEFPELADLNLFLKESEVMIENLDTFGADELQFRNNLGHLIIPTAEAVLSRAFSFGGQGQLGNAATVEEIANDAQGFRARNHDRYGHGVMNPTGVRTSAVTSMDASTRFFAAVNENSSPTMSGYELRSTASYLDDMSGYGTYAEDQFDATMENLLQPGVMKAAERARTGSTTDRNSAIALGDAMQKAWNSQPGSDSGREQVYDDILLTDIGGQVRLEDVLTIDFSNLAKGGEVSFRVDEDAIRSRTQRQRPGQSATERNAIAPFLVQPNPASVKVAAERAARKLQTRVNRDLKALGTINFLREEQATPDYFDVWENQRFSTNFGGFPVEEQVQ